jgi:hypothetical protein
MTRLSNADLKGSSGRLDPFATCREAGLSHP